MADIKGGLRAQIMRRLISHCHGDVGRAQAIFDAIDPEIRAWMRELAAKAKEATHGD